MLIVLDSKYPRQILADKLNVGFKQVLLVAAGSTLTIYVSRDLEHCNPVDGMPINLVTQYEFSNWSGDMWGILAVGTAISKFNLFVTRWELDQKVGRPFPQTPKKRESIWRKIFR